MLALLAMLLPLAAEPTTAVATERAATASAASIPSVQSSADAASAVNAVNGYLGASTGGQGVVGAALPAPIISEPRAYLPPGSARVTYRLVSGTEGSSTSSTEIEEFSAVSEQGQARWSVRAGSRSVWYLEQASDGSIGRTSQIDSARSLLSSFAPAELLLAPGMSAGQTIQREIAVTVRDASRPDDVKYRGSLTQTLVYVGAYSVVVPAGTYECILLDIRFKGSVGPASIDDRSFVLLAKGVGRVAAIEQKSISAFIFYNRDERHGRMLEAMQSVP